MQVERLDDEPSTSDLPLMTEGKVCVVCEDKSDGTHFGIDSCRACAAFFRRSITTFRKYSCKHGPEPCLINKSLRCMCRMCRFQKCFQMGMRKDMVQGRRDPIIPKIKDPEPLCAVAGGSKSSSSSPEASYSENKTFTLHVPLSLKEEILEEPKLLQKICVNYKELCSRRRDIELNMDPHFSSKMNTYGPLTGYALGTHGKLSEFGRAHMPTTWQFVYSTFEEFSQLSQDDQSDLFHSFLIILWGMDKNYHTFKKVDKEFYSKIMILSETTYFDMDRQEEWFCDLNHTQRNPAAIQNDLRGVLNHCMSKPRQRVLHGMKDMQIMDEEFAALIGLMLWNQNFEKTNDQVDRLAKTMRDRIFKELHLFYRSRHINMYAQRLGELMGLHSTILLEVLRFREDMELFSLIEAFKKDDFWLDMIRNSRCF